MHPLVICGASGLGKTHLLNAIAAEMRETSPDEEVICLKGDTFTNELVEAIRGGTSARFREKYRKASVFLMDDVQFIAGKKQTQEEFYYMFDFLYENGCSIVLVLDRPPRELGHLEDRLANRFEGGLMVEIGEPDHDTRLEIVRRKAEERGLRMEPGDAELIAERVTGSIRRLEGVLNRWKVMETDLRRDLLKELAEGSAAKKRTLSSEEIIGKAAAAYGIDAVLIKGRGRSGNAAAARQAAMYAMHHGLGLSTTKVGKIMNRDHSTVNYALGRAEDKLRTDPGFAERMKTLL